MSFPTKQILVSFIILPVTGSCWYNEKPDSQCPSSPVLEPLITDIIPANLLITQEGPAQLGGTAATKTTNIKYNTYSLTALS